MTSRHWCFTLPNPKACLDFQSSDCIRYAVYQEEVSNDTGLHHFQGYIELDRAARLSYVKKLKGLEKGHFEIRKGTRDQAREYCMKEDSRVDGPWEYGVWEAGGQGKRNDMTGMWDIIKGGATEVEIMEQFPELYMRYHGAVSKMCVSMNKGERTWKSIVTIIIGPPGVGKSKHCLDHYPGAYWLSNSRNNVWWQGYEKQETVIIDEFNYGWVPFDYLKRLLDGYPLQVEVKGGSRQFVAKEIIITCNKDPRVWYSDNNRFDDKALMRRMDKFIVMLEWSTQLLFNGHEEYITAYPIPTQIYV